MSLDELKERNRQPDHQCTRCPHRRDQHSYAREDDFMCLACPPDVCFYDPMTEEEWRVAFASLRATPREGGESR